MGEDVSGDSHLSEQQYMYICQASRYDRGVATRSRNPRGEGARLREQLLRAASEVLDEVGDADRVSVRAIARRAGVSPTALYLHFPDRDAAVAAAVDAGFVAFNAALRDAAVAAGEPRAALEAMGLAYLDFAEQQAALYAGLFSARRAMTPGAVDRDEGFDGLVAMLQAAEPRVRRRHRPRGRDRHVVGTARLRELAYRARDASAGRRRRTSCAACSRRTCPARA